MAPQQDHLTPPQAQACNPGSVGHAGRLACSRLPPSAPCWPMPCSNTMMGSLPGGTPVTPAGVTRMHTPSHVQRTTAHLSSTPCAGTVCPCHHVSQHITSHTPLMHRTCTSMHTHMRTHTHTHKRACTHPHTRTQETGTPVGCAHLRSSSVSRLSSHIPNCPSAPNNPHGVHWE